MLSGCSSRPISKTYHHIKKTYNTTKQVYHTTKAVAEMVNPLEYLYVSQHGEALNQAGEVFTVNQALIEPASDQAD